MKKLALGMVLAALSAGAWAQPETAASAAAAGTGGAKSTSTHH